MKSMAKWMLGAAVVAGGLGLAATPAKAADWGVYIGGPAAYVPPCPGPGYQWVAGYYADGYWVPGRWAFVGVGDGDDYGYVGYYGDRDDHRYYDRDGWRDRDWHDRGWHDRGWGNRGWGDRYRHDGDRYRR